MLRQVVNRSKHYLLRYYYVEGMKEKREPVRPAHLKHISDHEGKGLLLAGACLDPIDTGVLVFDVSDRKLVEEFAESDPYFKNNLITDYEVRDFLPVGGTYLSKDRA